MAAACPRIEHVIASEAARIIEAPATVTEVMKKLRLARQRVPTLLQHLKSHASRLRFVDTRSDALSEIVDWIELGHEGIVIKLSGLRLIGDNTSPDTPENSVVARRLTMKLKRRGVETKLIVGGIEARSSEANPALIKLISRAYRWWDGLVTGQVKSIAEIAETEKLSERYVSGILEVAFLAPSIVEQVVAGRQPPRLTWRTLTESATLPIGWLQQGNELSVGQGSAEREQVKPSGS